MTGPPNLPGRIPQSKSTPSLAAGSADSQHNYQNQEWLHHQLPARGPPGPPGPAGRSASTQNLARPPIPVEHEQGFYQNLQPGPPGQPHPRFGSQSSLAGRPGPGPGQHPGGPEKPQRQFSYELETAGRGGEQRGGGVAGRSVRFQDPGEELQQVGTHSRTGVDEYSLAQRVAHTAPQEQPGELAGLRPSAVEQEFRRRLQEYSDSEDVSGVTS